MEIVKEKLAKAPEFLKKKLGIDNVMATPKILKVVVSSGTGSITDRKKKELIEDRLTKITGQKAAVRAAKTSIANFKLREGQSIGVVVTLRGARMYAFLDKFVNIAMPNLRDFKGIDIKAIDNIGNITIGLAEHTIFPETADEDLKDVFGMSVTIVTSAKTKEDAEALLRHVGIPLKEAK